MPRLCNDCATLTAFRLADEPCDQCPTAAAAAPVAMRDDCSTLEAFGWTASTCDSCRMSAAA